MKKNLFLSMFATVCTLAIGASILAINSHSYKPMQAEPIQAGSITMDVNDTSIDLSQDTFTLKSALGNSFVFDNESHGIAKVGDVFKLNTGYRFENITPINGITSISFVTPEEPAKQHVEIYFRLATQTKNSFDEFDINAGGGTYIFSDINPSYFYFTCFDKDPFTFTKVIINYTCVLDVPEFDIDRVRASGIGTYSCYYEKGFFAPTGTSLSNIDLSHTSFDSYGHNSVYIDNDQNFIHNLTISYNNSDSTVVLEGENEASISFTYEGCLYSSNKFTLVGYDHYSFDPTEIRASNNRYLIANTDDIPNDFNISVSGYLYFYGASDNKVLSTYANLYDIHLTQDMIVTADEHPFSVYGYHTMTVSYLGVTSAIEYFIYDPSYCNIRNIYYYENLEVEVGTSTADFLTYILALTPHVDYYNYDDSLPLTITLTADNFNLTEGMFDSMGNVYVPIHYDTYIGTLYVSVRAGKGNLVGTYTNDPGIEIQGVVVTSVELYDNDVCTVNGEDQLFAYTLVGDLLTINTGYFDILFVLDDSTHTFTKYAKAGTVLYSLKVNFHALGAEDEYAYDGTMYDDGTIVFNIMGADMECAYTVDPVNEYIIYFTFQMGPDSVPCKGTIDPVGLTMLVEIVS